MRRKILATAIPISAGNPAKHTEHFYKADLTFHKRRVVTIQAFFRSARHAAFAFKRVYAYVVGEEIVKAANSKTPNERLAVVIADLQRRGLAMPRTVKTLSSTISTIFQKQLSEQDLTGLLAALEQQGVIAKTGTKVSYSLPA